MDSGVDDFLHKPFDRDRFIARVRVAMRILDLHQSLRLANTDSVRQIPESGRRLLTLIDHILWFSKSHANELSFEASGTAKSGQHSNLLRFLLAGGGRSGMTRIRFVRELVFVKVSAAEEGYTIEDVFLEPFQPEINHGRNVEGEQL